MILSTSLQQDILACTFGLTGKETAKRNKICLLHTVQAQRLNGFSRNEKLSILNFREL